MNDFETDLPSFSSAVDPVGMIRSQQEFWNKITKVYINLDVIMQINVHWESFTNKSAVQMRNKISKIISLICHRCSISLKARNIKHFKGDVCTKCKVEDRDVKLCKKKNEISHNTSKINNFLPSSQYSYIISHAWFPEINISTNPNPSERPRCLHRDLHLTFVRDWNELKQTLQRSANSSTS